MAGSPAPGRNSVSPPSQHRGGGEWLFDLITVFFLIASVGMVTITVLIINNPRVSFNPLPIAELPTQLMTSTPTQTYTPSSTFTPSVTPFPPTLTPTITETPPATVTLTPTITPTPVVAGIDPIPTLTPPPVATVAPVIEGTPPPFPFIAHEVRYETNSNDQGCRWLSIAGNATGFSGEPITDLPVEITGDDFEYIEFTGSEQRFGISGFEVRVGSTPEARQFAVRLFSPADIPISDFIQVTTRTTCDQNVVIIEFIQVGDY